MNFLFQDNVVIILQSHETLHNRPIVKKEQETTVILIIVYNILCEVRAYTVSYHLSTWTRYQEYSGAGGGAPGTPPPKIGKHMIFFA